MPSFYCQRSAAFCVLYCGVVSIALGSILLDFIITQGGFRVDSVSYLHATSIIFIASSLVHICTLPAAHGCCPFRFITLGMTHPHRIVRCTSCTSLFGRSCGIRYSPLHACVHTNSWGCTLNSFLLRYLYQVWFMARVLFALVYVGLAMSTLPDIFGYGSHL